MFQKYRCVCIACGNVSGAGFLVAPFLSTFSESPYGHFPGSCYYYQSFTLPPDRFSFLEIGCRCGHEKDQSSLWYLRTCCQPSTVCWVFLEAGPAVPAQNKSCQNFHNSSMAQSACPPLLYIQFSLILIHISWYSVSDQERGINILQMWSLPLIWKVCLLEFNLVHILWHIAPDHYYLEWSQKEFGSLYAWHQGPHREPSGVIGRRDEHQNCIKCACQIGKRWNNSDQRIRLSYITKGNVITIGYSCP